MTHDSPPGNRPARPTGQTIFRGRIVFRIGLLAALFLICPPVTVHATADEPPLEVVRRVVFLGDSITYSGQYIEYLETVFRTRYRALRCEFQDLGLPSETVSGLTEPGHAGGKFLRPDLHERL